MRIRLESRRALSGDTGAGMLAVEGCSVAAAQPHLEETVGARFGCC